MNDWRDISTAPKDGTVIDLWMVDETGKGWREADAYWVENRTDEEYSYVNGKTKCMQIRRDGWWAPNHDYDGGDGFADTPRYWNGHPNQQKWIFKLPTHWMPKPLPPTEFPT